MGDAGSRRFGALELRGRLWELQVCGDLVHVQPITSQIERMGKLTGKKGWGHRVLVQAEDLGGDGLETGHSQQLQQARR